MKPVQSAQQDESPARNARSFVLQVFGKKETAIFLALAAIMAFITIVSPTFMTASNMYLVSRQIALVAVVAMGELFVILTGGIDLSVGSVLGLSGVTTGLALNAGIPPFFAVLIGLSTGLAAGLVNGLFVSYVKIPPFIVTLGMLSMARGTIWIITQGWPVTSIPESFLWIAQGDVLGIPVPVVLMVIVAVVAHITLTRTAFGRRVFAIGGNERVTFLSGINVKRIKFVLYGICGGLAATIGAVLVARFRSAQAAMGEGWELDAIAAAVIGGTSLMGGSGSVAGVIIGAAIMGVIRNGLVLMKVSPYWQTAVIGAIIVLAAIVDRLKNRRAD